DGDRAAGLRAALADRDVADRRAEEGARRGGRGMAAAVMRRVLEA
ncbi:MAG: biotin-independent malonate decarboxylase subunit gamma, partial [Caulobacter sp.]|nr:biotin-independent malonate decarboxylase subunit gamma [Vitreoscilla sp.]